MDHSKLGKMQREKELYETRKAQQSQITSEKNQLVSNLQGQEKTLNDQHVAAQKDYNEALQKPHEHLEQLMDAQDRMKHLTAESEKTRKALGFETEELKKSIGKEVEIASDIQKLDTKIESQQISESPEQWAENAKRIETSFDVAGKVFDQNLGVAGQLMGEGYQIQKRRDAEIMTGERALHEKQLGEVADLKGRIKPGMEAAKAEMEKTMGGEMSPAAQKAFYAAEFDNAFHQANELRAHQQQERATVGTAILSHSEQQQERAGMSAELDAAHFTLTRGLAEQQATINVDIDNQSMLMQEQKRLESKGVTPDGMSDAMKPLEGILTDQRQSDIWSQTNKIHSQQCPELAANPPAPEFAPQGPSQSQGGPGSGPAPPAM